MVLVEALAVGVAVEVVVVMPPLSAAAAAAAAVVMSWRCSCGGCCYTFCCF